MCTTGAVILAEDDYILFKNKDFSKIQFSDHLVTEPEVFGVRGLETFGEQEVTREIFSGLSIGSNQHGLLCCDSHVSYEPSGAANYDRLVEVALRSGIDVPTAIKALEQHLPDNPSWAGNIVLTDGILTARVEVRNSELAVEYSAQRVVSTNHQFLFAHDNSPVSSSSKERLVSAKTRLASAQSCDDVFALLASHDRGETGICNHQAELKTVYSYLLRCTRGEVTLYVTNQQPCVTQHYQALKLPLGEQWSEAAAQQLVAQYPR